MPPAFVAVALLPGTWLITFSSLFTPPVRTGTVIWQLGCCVPPGRGGTTAPVMVMVRAWVSAASKKSE